MTAARSYRVLLVCTGNTCRTPMAVALLRRLFDRAGIDAEVRSAGTHALSGAPAHPDAREVARAAGLDLSDHRAQPLTPELVGWADIVLGMSRSHASRARALDETADARVLTEFDPAGPHREGIPDPIGCDREVYADSFERIRACLVTFVESRTSHSATGAIPPEAG